MKSRWIHMREAAIEMRREGRSLPSIHAELGIPRSTLSGWFKNIILTKKQKEVLSANWKSGLVLARMAAAQKHRTNKEQRINTIKKSLESEYSAFLRTRDTKCLEISLAMLYFGEGAKTDSRLGLGNSDPLLLKFYVNALEKLYGIERSSLQVYLHLRMDQDSNRLTEYWSHEIEVPAACFKGVLRDKRTFGKPSYPGYHGVCYVGGGGVDIQRRLMYLAEAFCRGGF